MGSMSVRPFTYDTTARRNTPTVLPLRPLISTVMGPLSESLSAGMTARVVAKKAGSRTAYTLS